MSPSATINFTTLGDRTTASSRLRAWMIADWLNQHARVASVGAEDIARIEVFQKQQNFPRLRRAKRAGATVVFDFDDNYLLAEVGTRNDVLRFMLGADLVMVGSQALYEEAVQHHDDVYLFQNPIDVALDAPAREERPWRGDLVWFGNRTNLTALEETGLGDRVATITQGGDLEWRVETIDADLTRFDLAVLPVRESQWTLSKNANRMLKCAALKVPFLASRTPEHQRTVEQLGLSSRYLVDYDGDWNAAIDALAGDSARLSADMDVACEAARALYGITPVARAWMHQIERVDRARRARRAPRRLRLASRVVDPLGDIDVIVFNENEAVHAERTLTSLRLDEVSFSDVTVVQPLASEPSARHGARAVQDLPDFFDLYPEIARAMNDGVGSTVLVLRGGATVHRGMFGQLGEVARDLERPTLLHAQLGSPEMSLAAPPPSTLDELLLHPYLPHALVVPRRLLQAVGGLAPHFANLAWWELLIRCARHQGAPPILLEETTFEINRTVNARDLITSYLVYLRQRGSPVADELPSKQAETWRLTHTLHAHIVEEHQPLFAAYSPVLLPLLGVEQRSLTASRHTVEVKLARLTKEHGALLKRKNDLQERRQEALDGYERRKAKEQEALEAVKRLHAEGKAATKQVGSLQEANAKLETAYQDRRDKQRAAEDAYARSKEKVAALEARLAEETQRRDAAERELAAAAAERLTQPAPAPRTDGAPGHDGRRRAQPPARPPGRSIT